MKTLFRIAALIVLFTLPSFALAQDRTVARADEPAYAPKHVDKDGSKIRFQALVGYVNSEVKNPLEAVQNVRTLSVDAKLDVVNKSGWTFGPAFNYKRAYDVEVIPDSMIYPNGIYRDVDTFGGGAEVAKKAGVFRFGGGFFVLTRKLHMDMDREYGRLYRGFVELNAGPVVIRPFVAEAEVFGGFNANRITRYGASAGVRLPF